MMYITGMTTIQIKSSAQTATFRIDHRKVECQFFRVQSRKPGQHLVMIRLLRDAGANLGSYDPMMGARLRRDFNTKGFSYVTDEVFNKIVDNV